MTARSEKLQPASFRGVPFQVEAGSRTAGRRNQVHEYPKRDEGWVEDLGRSLRSFTITGFVIGDDYVDQAKKLLDALEVAGPGTLVHPWHGSVNVSLKEDATVAYSRALGQATFELSFIEAGANAYPAATATTGAQSRFAADALSTAAITDFASKFTVKGMPDFVTAAAAGDFTRIVNLLGTSPIPGLAYLNLASKSASALSNVLGLFNSPASLAQTVMGIFGVADAFNTANDLVGTVQSLLRLSSHSSFTAPPAAPIVTPSLVQQATNTAATNTLVRQALLVQAVGLSSVIPAVVYNDTVALRDNLAKALDAEATTASDPVYAALDTARTAMWRDLTDRARNSARLTTLRPAETTPALVLAYDFYEDAARDADLVARNAIRHPGFVPPNPLLVLAS